LPPHADTRSRRANVGVEAGAPAINDNDNIVLEAAARRRMTYSALGWEHRGEGSITNPVRATK
ncbi:hypothetical protein, partial [Rhizobium ruizarguesonis]|uniref:hypothetical protein n=1 Tax=Rhizobium ruizarguesonis TaxID=2081791 RepID=UPI001CF1EDEC